MRILRIGLLLTGFMISAVAIGQTDAQVPGRYTDGPALRFFEMLTFGDVRYGPTTFEEVVENSSVIAAGNLIDVIPGRSIGLRANRAAPSMATVFLKFVPSRLLKGTREEYYLVEVPAPQRMVSELRDQLYTGNLVVLLRPASNLLVDPRISVSPEARAEWVSGKSLYMLTMRSTLFAISAPGYLASPLDVYREFVDLYTSIRSLAELEAHILSFLGDELIQDDQNVGGSRQWYENVDQDREPQGLVQEWYESGQLRSEINYFNGEMEGPARYWYEGGALQAESHFANGKAEGQSRFWYESGQLSFEATFEDGQRVECQAWTRDGSPIDCSDLSMGWFGSE